MSREMRRNDRKTSEEKALEILKCGEYGIFAMNGDDGFPYGVPVSFAVIGKNIYIHGTIEGGYRHDAIAQNGKACFTVVSSSEVEPAAFATFFSSAIAVGNVEIVTDEKEKKDALDAITNKYSADFPTEGQKYIKGKWDNTEVVCIKIAEITGKEKANMAGK